MSNKQKIEEIKEEYKKEFPKDFYAWSEYGFWLEKLRSLQSAHEEEMRGDVISKIDELINRWDELAVVENQDKVIYEDMADLKKSLTNKK